MTNKLWVFGDSFSTEFNIKSCHQNHIEYMKLMGVDTMEHWPNILSSKLNYELINCARGGASNYQIFFNFCERVKEINENDIVLIGWALIGKFLIADKSGFINIHPYDQHNHSTLNNITIKDIIENRKSLQWKLEVDHWVKIIKEVINLKKAKAIFWSGEEEMLKNEFIDITKCLTMSNETNNTISDSHLGIKGHITLADNFFNLIVNE